MAKNKRTKTRLLQWKVFRGIGLDMLASICDEWTQRGWIVRDILGPFHDGLALVLTRVE